LGRIEVFHPLFEKNAKFGRLRVQGENKSLQVFKSQIQNFKCTLVAGGKVSRQTFSKLQHQTTNPYRTMNARAIEAHLRANKKNRVVHQVLDRGSNPMCMQHLVARTSGLIELFLASRWFVDTPRKFSDLNSSDRQMREVYLHLVELFNYIGSEIGSGVSRIGDDLVPDQFVTFEVCPARVFKHEEGEEGVVEGEDAIRPEGVAAVELSHTIQDRPAGYRLRIMTQSDASNAGAILDALLTENQKKVTDVKKKRGTFRTSNEPPNEALEYLYALTLEEYVRLCSIYTSDPINPDIAAATPLTDPSNPANPYRVFSLTRSMVLADKACVNSTFCKEIEYLDHNREPDPYTGIFNVYDWPDPKLVWRMKPMYLLPGNATRVYWPCVESSTPSTDPQRQAYIKINAPSGDAAEVEKAAYVYDNYIARSGSEEEQAEDFDALKLKHFRRVQDAVRDSKTEAERRKRLSEAQLKTLNDFMVVFSPDGNAPDPIKAIARHMNEYLTEQESFCLELSKFTTNLTRFGDEMLMLMITIETLWNVNTQHKDALSLFFKQLHVYALTPFNLHTMNSGPGMAGKSFGFDLVMKWLIPGTYESTTYSSSKANVVPGHKNQCMLRFYHDAPPSFLGIQANTKGSDTANTDMEAIVKAWLTSGRLSAHVLDTTLGRANAVTAEICAKVESCVNVSTNASSSSVPAAMGTRFHQNTWQNKDRLEGGGLLGKANKVSNREQKTAEELFKMRLRRNQALTSVILLMSYVGILPQVDMTVAKFIFTQTLQEAKKANLSGVDDIRNFERLEMLCRVLVVWDAISIVWDSPDSPLAHVAHHPKHFLCVARYLRSNVDHATFALGLLSNQFEDPIIHSILDDLMNTRFKSLKETKKNRKRANDEVDHEEDGEGAGEEGSEFKPYEPSAVASKSKRAKTTMAVGDPKQTTLPTTAQENGMAVEDEDSTTSSKNNKPRPLKAVNYTVPRMDANYYIAPFVDKRETGGRSVHIDSNYARVQLLAAVQLTTMQEKPLKGDLIFAYESLLNKQIDDMRKPEANDDAADVDVDEPSASEDGPKAYGKCQIPALNFKDNEIFLSRHLVKEHKRNALLRCTEKVINHLHADEGEYVYGVTRENTPFLLETIKVGPGAPLHRKKKLQVIDPNFFDESLVIITENFLQGAAKAAGSRRRKDQKKLTIDEHVHEIESKFALRNAFSKLPRFFVDLDLNTYADALFKHKERDNISTVHFNVMMEGHPLKRAIQLIEMVEQSNERRRLIQYPTDLPHACPRKYFNDQTRAMAINPEKYSLSAHLVRMEEDVAPADPSNSQPSEGDLNTASEYMRQRSYAEDEEEFITHEEVCFHIAKETHDVDDEERKEPERDFAIEEDIGADDQQDTSYSPSDTIWQEKMSKMKISRT
jgi:hypothetical protein